DYDPHPALFDLAEQTLRGLIRGDDVARWVYRFELGTLAVLGHLPSLETCVECGRPVAPTDRVAFGLLSGGGLCGDCRSGKRQVVSISGGTLRAMVDLADLQTETWIQTELNAKTRGELRGLIGNYISHLLGHRPRMHEHLAP